MLEFVLVYIFLIFLISVIYSFRKKDMLNPLSLFVIPLFFQYLIYYIFYRKDHVVSAMTLSVYLLGLTSYVLGYFLFEEINKKRDIVKNITIEYKTNWKFVHFCLGVGVICLILTRLYLIQLNISDYDLGGRAANLREAFVYSLDTTPFYVTYGKYFLLFSVTIYFYEFLHRNQQINKLFMLFLIIILMINAFNVVSRTDLLITIMPLLVIWMDSNNRKKLINKVRVKSQILVVASILGISLLMNIMRSTNNNYGLFDKNSSLIQYIGKPIIAFDQWILPHSNASKEILFLEPINKVLLKLELIDYDNIKLASLGQFNVYTYLKVPYMEFGLLGVLVLMLLIGILVNYLYLKSKTGSRNWLIFYSFYSYAIVMSFFDWQFGITTYAYLILFLIGTSFINTKYRNKL